MRLGLFAALLFSACSRSALTVPDGGSAPVAHGSSGAGPLQCGAEVCDALHTSFTCTTAGACAVTGCDSGWADCDGDAKNGCEIDLTTDVYYCGACNHTSCFGAGPWQPGSGTLSIGASTLIAAPLGSGNGTLLALGARVHEQNVTVQLGLYSASDAGPSQLLVATDPITTAATDEPIVGAVPPREQKGGTLYWFVLYAYQPLHIVSETATVNWYYASPFDGAQLPPAAPPMQTMSAALPDFWMVEAN